MWRVMIAVGILIGSTSLRAQDQVAAPGHPDPVISRVFEHLGGRTPLAVRLAQSSDFHEQAWRRVRDLIAFRVHRPVAGGGTRPDAVIYLSSTSDLYLKAAAVLRTGATTHEYVWCLLASVIAHETAHTAPNTERHALTAEVESLRRCLLAGHLHASDGWNAVTYIGKVEARLRKPREHQ